MLGGEIKKTRLCFLHFLLTAWVSSLAAAVLYFSAPLSTSLSKRYGCRSVTIAGTFICILGMVLSSFYRSLYYLYVTHGVIWGLGQAMCYFPSFFIISQHFETRYSLAIGIAVCGASVGTLVQSPGTDWLFRRFGLAWSFQILGATYLIVIPCGLIFRPAVDGASVPLERFKDGAYYCYCAYVLRISRYSDFQSPMLTNTGIFLRGLKLSGESRS